MKIRRNMRFLSTRAAIRLAALAGLFLGAPCQAGAGPRAIDPETRNELWHSDLKYFATNLPTHQLDFFKRLPLPQFEEQMVKLDRDIPHLSDPEITLELMRLAASLGIANTLVETGGLITDVYPIRMQWFSDGLGVVYAAPPYRRALGPRHRHGGLPAEQALAAVAPYISHENDAQLRHESPSYFMLTELMRRANLAGADGDLVLTLQRTNGPSFTVEVAPSNPNPASTTNWISAEEELRIPPPFYRQKYAEYYGYQYLPDSQTLYLQYNRCLDDPKKSFAALAAEMFAFADAHPVERMIVDLRFNAGGDPQVSKSLLDGLEARPSLANSGKLRALIGSSTFSAGLEAALDLRNDFHAQLVGRPTGGKPNSYGDPGMIVLPNSKLRVHYTVKFIRLSPNSDPPSLEPDLAAPFSLDDYLAGRDPILDAALHR